MKYEIKEAINNKENEFYVISMYMGQAKLNVMAEMHPR